MPLFDAITRLINEHGSADILKTHLALVRDQAAAIEKENGEMKAKLEDAEAQRRTDEKTIATLTADLAALRRGLEKPKTKWGCLEFADDPQNLYCVACYYQKNQRIPTSRRDVHNRWCPVCRLDIPAG